MEEQEITLDEVLISFWVGAVIFGCVVVVLVGLMKALTFLAIAFFF